MNKLIWIGIGALVLTGCGTIVPSTERVDQNVAADMGGAGYDYHRVETVSPDGTKQVETRIRSTSQRDITNATGSVHDRGNVFLVHDVVTDGEGGRTDRRLRQAGIVANVVLRPDRELQSP